MGLNEKLKVREDLEEDLQSARVLTSDAERARTELHLHLEQAAWHAQEESEKNKKYQDIIIR